MYKKAIWSIVLIAIVGVLIYGAVNRTLAKTIDSEPASVAASHDQATEVASSQSWGRGQSEKAGEEAEHAPTGESHGRQDQNATDESWQGQGNGRGQNRQSEQDHEDFGEAEGQGYGRQGQNTTDESWQGQGKGRNRQSEQTTAGNVEAEHANMAWQTVQGEVVSLASDAMIIETASGASVLVEGMPWSYAQKAGFAAEMGDEVTLNGFEEDGEFKVGELANDVSGQLVQIREVSGRPLWAGGGRGQNRN